MTVMHRYRGLCAWALGVFLMPCLCHAGLFDDEEARRAVLELRQKVEAQGQAADKRDAALQEENATLKKALLDLQASIEQLRLDLSKQTGAQEALTKTLSDLQQQSSERWVALDERLLKLEPLKVKPDGQEFVVDRREMADYEAALALFRNSQYKPAQAAFANFLRHYPNSGYAPMVTFWQGSSAFGSLDYKESLALMRTFVRAAPESAKVPEALLVMANSQIELKDKRLAKQTLEEIVKKYPQSEAAAAAKDRLSRLR